MHLLRQPQLQLPLELDALRCAPAPLRRLKFPRLVEQHPALERERDLVDLDLRADQQESAPLADAEREALPPQRELLEPVLRWEPELRLAVAPL